MLSLGDPITDTNFGPDFNSHTTDIHALNDCVIMKKTGEWTDVPCGVALVLGTGFGESHPFICQYSKFVFSANLHRETKTDVTIL